ncbi:MULTISPECIES: hypothetical protein [unclassified Pseudomonas]|uniref:hypothetical protein n=1 Tax=unclassified Pseudomonas TaxID=196821 RepID=UPI0015879299|nr:MULTISPECIES: hypothetical protein [unclassified Pseudomonas]
MADQGFVEHAKQEEVEELRLRKFEFEAVLGQVDKDLMYVESCVENRYVFPRDEGDLG